MIIPSDPTTWPGYGSQDPLWKIAHAIAYAEGYNVEGSNPAKLNNPGDVSDGAAHYGYEHHSGSNVTNFPTADVGWEVLYEKLRRIRDGESQVYDPLWSWNQIAQKWSGNWQNWVKNVCAELGVDPQSRFADYLNG